MNQDIIKDLMDRIRKGEDISDAELDSILTTADRAGILYYRMLTMVSEQRSLAELPNRLKQIIKLEAWKQWRWVGSTFSQSSLGAYLTKPPPNGVGIELETVEKLIADDPEAVALYRQETTAPARRPKKDEESHDNIMTSHQGTSRAYLVARLKEEHPELFARVVAKELSPRAAAIEAGIVKPPSPLVLLRKAWKKASQEECAKFLGEIAEEIEVWRSGQR